jgi:hypothetical protein
MEISGTADGVFITSFHAVFPVSRSHRSSAVDSIAVSWATVIGTDVGIKGSLHNPFRFIAVSFPDTFSRSRSAVAITLVVFSVSLIVLTAPSVVGTFSPTGVSGKASVSAYFVGRIAQSPKGISSKSSRSDSVVPSSHVRGTSLFRTFTNTLFEASPVTFFNDDTHSSKMSVAVNKSLGSSHISKRREHNFGINFSLDHVSDIRLPAGDDSVSNNAISPRGDRFDINRFSSTEPGKVRFASKSGGVTSESSDSTDTGMPL